MGSAQFGMKYGINNKTGQPSEEECFDILDSAINQGIDMIDTARAYGTSELVIGKYLNFRKYQDKVKIISKLRPNIIEPDVKDKYSVIRKELEESLERLQVSKLEGYLLHTPEYVYDTEIIQVLIRLKEEKLVQNIGVSIYGIEEGNHAIKLGLDYIQLPYSILDQRGYRTGFLAEAKKYGVKIFTRSTFLQGLFMMDLHKIPVNLKGVKPYLKYLEKLLEEYEKNKVELLLQFAKETKEIDYIVLGVDNKNQLLEDLYYYNMNMKLEDVLLKELREYFGQVEDNIILPSLWANGKKAN